MITSYELHGDTGTRLYRIWKSMKCRCDNANHPTYKYYGERGIHICEDWHESYSIFREWAMSHGYCEDLELERIDVNKGYNPSNCTWVTHHAQTKNRRNTLYITIGGKTFNFQDFCITRHLNRNTVRGWRYQGILEEKLSNIFNQPVVITGGTKRR